MVGFMALSDLTQAHKILDKAGSILLLVPEKPSFDALSSMIALYLALHHLKPDMVDAVSPSHVPPNLQFLPGSSQIKMKPQTRPDLVLDVAGPTEISAVRTERLSGGIRVHITFPEHITITKDTIETLIRPLPYDTVVVFGATDLEDLGSIFTNHADFFYNTPIINVDYRAANEHFGTVNLVDITASSIAEVTYDFIEDLTKSLDADTATALYAGMVAGTESFQKPSTTPRSFHIAAQLMEHHAQRELVIRYLVKTKPLPLLKLLGRLYARLRYDEHIRLFWSILQGEDFAESETTPTDLSDVIKELTNNVASFHAIFVVYEYEGAYTLCLILGKGLKKRSAEIQTLLNAKRDNGLMRIPLQVSSIREAKEKALNLMRDILPVQAV